ncbi:hypothetical protein [Haladaptatus sp. AB643]|uniref:hypothetical protein n=1 Tax=Haladaptatus sp. AB643 TaxID=2934174 RepID=UPI00209C0823|nr:hypothetical protein [Haladaptatus sp. AB643]MCO8243116.1 hypothetical protein [Haladaptatus sp. AB643]
MNDEGKANEIFHRLKRDWWLFLLALGLLAAVPIAWHLSSITQYTFIDWIQVVSLLGSLVLSLTLAFLYQGLKELQGKQNRLMEVEHEPELELDQVKVVDSTPNAPSGLVVYLSNVGKGTANNLSGKIETSPIPESNLEFSLSSKTINLERYDELLQNKSDKQLIKNQGSFLRPNESRVAMFLPLLVKYDSEDGGGTTLISELPFGLSMRFNDSLCNIEHESERRDEGFPEKEWVEVQFKSEGRMWMRIDPEKKRFINNNDFGMDILEDDHETAGLPNEDILRKRIENTLDFNKFRINVSVEYTGSEKSGEKNLEIIDRVIPIRHGEDVSVLFAAGEMYEDHQRNDRSDFIFWNLASDIADREISEEIT